MTVNHNNKEAQIMNKSYNMTTVADKHTDRKETKENGNNTFLVEIHAARC